MCSLEQGRAFASSRQHFETGRGGRWHRWRSRDGGWRAAAPPITTAWGRVPPLPSSPLLCVIISLFLSPFSLSEDFIGHPHTPLGIAWRRHLALRRFTFLVPGLDRTQTPDCSVRRGEAQAGLGPSAVDSSRPTPEPRRRTSKGTALLCLAAAEELGRCTQLCAGQSRVWKWGRASHPGFHAVAKPESRSRTARPAFLPVLTGAPAHPAASRPQHCPAGRGRGETANPTGAEEERNSRSRMSG